MACERSPTHQGGHLYDAGDEVDAWTAWAKEIYPNIVTTVMDAAYLTGSADSMSNADVAIEFAATLDCMGTTPLAHSVMLACGFDVSSDGRFLEWLVSKERSTVLPTKRANA